MTLLDGLRLLQRGQWDAAHRIAKPLPATWDPGSTASCTWLSPMRATRATGIAWRVGPFQAWPRLDAEMAAFEKGWLRCPSLISKSSFSQKNRCAGSGCGDCRPLRPGFQLAAGQHLGQDAPDAVRPLCGEWRRPKRWRLPYLRVSAQGPAARPGGTRAEVGRRTAAVAEATAGPRRTSTLSIFPQARDVWRSAMSSCRRIAQCSVRPDFRASVS